MLERSVRKSTIINASAAELWKHITDSARLGKSLFNADIQSSWREGSPIRFTGHWKGRDYEGKGQIIQLQKEKIFEHSYLSNLSGLPDTPEHYCPVTYCLEEKEHQTVLSVIQTNIPSQADGEEIGTYWETVLRRIRTAVEGVANPVN